MNDKDKILILELSVENAYYLDLIKKLQAENEKLEKCIRLFAFPEGRLDHGDVERVARQVLKELGDK